jgi:hypothetical protein
MSPSRCLCLRCLRVFTLSMKSMPVFYVYDVYIMSMSHMMSIPIIYDMDNMTISIMVKIVLCVKMLSVVAPDYGFHDNPPNQHFPEMLTKTFSVFSHPTTLAKSPKLAAQTFRTWKRGSTQSAANLSRNTDSVISFPISGAILLKSWTNAK